MTSYKIKDVIMTDSKLLLQKWSPIVYLHSKEKYFPCSADWLLKNSTLVDYSTNPVTKISPVTNMDLYENARLHDFKKNEYFVLFNNKWIKSNRYKILF